MVHVDDVLTFSKKKTWIDIFVQSLFCAKETFELTDEGSVDKHLGADVNKRPNGSC